MARTVKRRVYKIGELKPKAKAKALAWGSQMLQESWDSSDSDSLEESLKEHAKYCHGVQCNGLTWSLSYCQGDGVAFFGRLDRTVLADMSNVDDHKQFTTKEQRKRIIELMQLLDDAGYEFSIDIGDRPSNYHWRGEVIIDIDECPSFEPEDVRWEVENWLTETLIGPANPAIDTTTVGMALTCRTAAESGDLVPTTLLLDHLDENGMFPKDVKRMRAIVLDGPEKYDKAQEELEKELEEFMKEANKDTEGFGYRRIEYLTEDLEHVEDFLEANDYEFFYDGSRSNLD
jgi:hypothetical protein